MNPIYVAIPNRVWVDIHTNKALPRQSDNDTPPNAPGEWRAGVSGYAVFNKRAGSRTSLGAFPSLAAAQAAADSMNGIRR